MASPSCSDLQCKIVLTRDQEIVHKADTIGERHGGSSLQGYVEVRSKHRLNSDIWVLFEGLSRVWRTEQQGDRPGPNYVGRDKFLSQIQHIRNGELDHVQSSTGFNYKLPFQFDIAQRALPSTHTANEELSRLPPSLKYGPEYQPKGMTDVFMQPAIVYTLRCSINEPEPVPEGHCKRHNFVREVTIVPVRNSPPPLDVRDFPGEYVTSAKKSLKQHLWTSPIGSLSISSIEPSPVNISSTSMKSHTTVKMKVLFEPSPKHAKSVFPVHWAFVLDSKLLVKTFCSTEPLFHEQPDLKTVKSHHTVSLKTHSMPIQHQTLKCDSWRMLYQADGTDSPPSEGKSIWVTTIEVPITLQGLEVPCFITPLAARRHVLDLQLRLEGMYQAVFDLKLPLQVFCQATSPEEDNDDEVGFLLHDDTMELDLSEPPPYE